MIRKTVFLYLLILFQPAYATEYLYVNIFNKKAISHLTVIADNNAMEVFTGGVPVYNIEPKKKIEFYLDKKNVKAFSLDTFRASKFIIYTKGSFSIYINNDSTKKNTYQGNLMVLEDKGNLVLINLIDIEDYLKAVLRAEIGPIKGVEFLKSMAIVSRTYALKNRYKHSAEIFDLCDKTHCQVYTGKLEANEEIIAAIESTKGIIVVDEDCKPINTVFHSNSGGVTSKASDVWMIDFPYLQSKKDTFSNSGWGYKWTYKTTKDKWLAYLSNKTGKKIIEYEKPTWYYRRKEYKCGDNTVPLSEMRKDLRLKSTMFVLKEVGKQIILYGRGFGHGVGLSQMGAKRMSDLGFNFREIIQFYYSGVEIVDFEVLPLLGKF